MIYPEGDAIKERVHNRYSLVVLAAKRARQLKEGAPVLIDTASTNFLTIALEEIAVGKVTYIEVADMEIDDEAPTPVATPAPARPEHFLSVTPPAPAPAPDTISPELAAFLPSTDELTADDSSVDEEDEKEEDEEEDDSDDDDDADDDSVSDLSEKA